MRRMLALLVLAPLGACVQRDIPVPESNPGRQDALCAIAFSQWLGVDSHDIAVAGHTPKGPNAVVQLTYDSPPLVANCEITPAGGLVALVMSEPGHTTTRAAPSAVGRP